MSSLLCVGAVTALVSASARADESYTQPPQKPLAPAARYNGRTPIDLTNGILFNNGTFGQTDADYEDWSKHDDLPGFSEKPYPYERKDAFLNAMNDQVRFFDTALYNWAHTSNRWPEAGEYSKNATNQIQPALDRLQDAISKAKSAGSDSWKSAEDEARHALVDARLAYTQLHKNVVNR